MTSTTSRLLLRRTTAVVGIAGLALLGSAVGASAQTYTPTTSATFSDATPEPGQAVFVSGSAVAGTTVSITLARPDGTIITLGTVTADATGSFALSVSLPSDLAAGNYVIAAVNGTTILSSSAFAVSGATTQGDIIPAQTTNATNPTGGNNAAPAQATTLPVTGGDAGLLLWSGAAFVVIGGSALVVSKRRNDPEVATLTI